MTEIENEPPIYEVFEQPFTIPTSLVHETNPDNELNESNNLSNVNLELAEELIRMAEKRDNTFEKTFIERVLLKIKSDLRNRFCKQSAAKFLHETFRAEMLHDDNFLSWLAKRLDYKTYRLRNVLSSYEQQTKSCRHTLSVSQHQKIYDFWLDENVSIPSTDKRSGCQEIRIGKLQYIKELKHLEHISDENCKEKDVTLKKTGKTKTYIVAQCKIYTKPIRQLYQEFKGNIDFDCSLATFYKFKPFYIGPPIEREKESCLFIKCQNTHLLLKGINNFPKSKKLNQLDSVTEFLALKESMSDEDLEKSTWNSLHQRKHHIVCSRKKLSLTLKMEKRKIMSKLHVSTRMTK